MDVRDWYHEGMNIAGLHKFLLLNQLDAGISQIYFSNKTLHVSGSSSAHHQKFFNVHTAMACQQTCTTYTIAVNTVKNSW